MAQLLELPFEILAHVFSFFTPESLFNFTLAVRDPRIVYDVLALPGFKMDPQYKEARDAMYALLKSWMKPLDQWGPLEHRQGMPIIFDSPIKNFVREMDVPLCAIHLTYDDWITSAIKEYRIFQNMFSLQYTNGYGTFKELHLEYFPIISVHVTKKSINTVEIAYKMWMPRTLTHVHVPDTHRVIIPNLSQTSLNSYMGMIDYADLRRMLALKTFNCIHATMSTSARDEVDGPVVISAPMKTIMLNTYPLNVEFVEGADENLEYVKMRVQHIRIKSDKLQECVLIGNSSSVVHISSESLTDLALHSIPLITSRMKMPNLTRLILDYVDAGDGEIDLSHFTKLQMVDVPGVRAKKLIVPKSANVRFRSILIGEIEYV